MKQRIEIKPEELHSDPFTMIGTEWMLVSAKKEGVVNTMTASWGGMGILWNKKVAFVFLRPQRYTKEFIDATDQFSLSFYDANYRKQLSYLGTVSGRDENKIEKTGFHIVHEDEVPYFEEANTVLICRKLYAQEMQETCFLQEGLIDKNYPNKDYHTMYVVEIEKVITQETLLNP